MIVRAERTVAARSRRGRTCSPAIASRVAETDARTAGTRGLRSSPRRRPSATYSNSRHSDRTRSNSRSSTRTTACSAREALSATGRAAALHRTTACLASIADARGRSVLTFAGTARLANRAAECVAHRSDADSRAGAESRHRNTAASGLRMRRTFQQNTLLLPCIRLRLPNNTDRRVLRMPLRARRERRSAPACRPRGHLKRIRHIDDVRQREIGAALKRSIMARRKHRRPHGVSARASRTAPSADASARNRRKSSAQPVDTQAMASTGASTSRSHIRSKEESRTDRV